jgi:hypothetical protein
VKGLDGLASAITGVITGTESLKSAFHNLAASILADLIQMTIKMLIFKALSAALGGRLRRRRVGDGVISSGLSSRNSLPAASTRGGLIPAGTFGIVGEKGPGADHRHAEGRDGAAQLLAAQGSAPRTTAGPASASPTYNDFRGADPQAVAAIGAKIDQMERALPRTIVTTMQDARTALRVEVRR